MNPDEGGELRLSKVEALSYAAKFFRGHVPMVA
jgi:hypothetical protein